METYEKAVNIAREQHVPVLIHVEEVTQPQGHSTSGSHERYKTPERLKWEIDFDCITKLGDWIIEKGLATEEELKELQNDAKKEVKEAKKAAWESFIGSIKAERDEAVSKLEVLVSASENGAFLQPIVKGLKTDTDPSRKGILNVVRKAIRTCRNETLDAKTELTRWLSGYQVLNNQRFSGNLYSQSDLSPLNQPEILPQYDENAADVDGRVVLRDNFDKIFEKYPETLIFGEDSGRIGDVNQGLEGMQEKYGELRVSDTGIREATITGQGIGMAMRGLRPIAEIQYLDYLLYCLQIMSDDLATLQYRSAGGQKAPLIVRTRGHRLEGIWHSGSPMGVILNAIKGIHVCVPRNLTTAAGFYNTLLKGDDPALVIEPLNAYRSKEKMPNNLGEFQIELGVPEVVTEGTDITIVTYGSTFNLAEEVVNELNQLGISVELIDVRTLMPFDKNHSIVESLKKTNKVLFLDEDVKGGGTAFMMQKVLEEQGGYYHLRIIDLHMELMEITSLNQVQMIWWKPVTQ